MVKQQRDQQGRFTANGNGRVPLLTDNQLEEMVHNAMLSREDFSRRFLDPRRDIDDECGYPKTSEMTADIFRRMYDRMAIACRVVQVLPVESWKVSPTVFEDEDVETNTAFEEAWDEMVKGLRGDSWYQDEEGNPVWEYLRRGDIQSGIGTYGIILLGLDDGKSLDQAIDGFDNNAPSEGRTSSTPRKLLFLRTMDESLAAITKYEVDKTNPRFGQPTQYDVTFNDPRTTSQQGANPDVTNQSVHWSRVIHLADNLGNSEVIGVSRMQPVYNRLWDLRKLYGGSAEMYWRGAFPGLSIKTHPQLGGEVKYDREKMRTQMEQYMNGLQRYMALTGWSAKSLAPQVVDPTPQINTQLEAICIKLGVPKRIFTGSERGELASSQDAKAWNGRLTDRQHNYITPKIVVPFIDRLIQIGVLPEPEGYSIVWPSLASLSEDEQATIAVKRTEAMVKYVQGGVENLIAPIDYLTRFFGLTDQEAEQVIETTMQAIEPMTLPEEEPEEDFPLPGEEEEKKVTNEEAPKKTCKVIRHSRDTG